MGVSHIGLVHHRIVERGVYLHVSQQVLHLFDGHAPLYRHRGKGTAEFVRMEVLQSHQPADGAHPYLHSAHGETGVWCRETDKQSRASVCACRQIPLKVNLGAGVEIDLALFVALAEHDAPSAGEIHILAIDFYEFSHAHARAQQNVHHCQIARVQTSVVQYLDVLVGEHFLHPDGCTHTTDAPCGTFGDVVLVF